MVSINELMVVMKAVRERKNELAAMRNQVAVKRRFFGTTETTEEPQYDVKAVDRKVAELELFLLRADAAIKASNAVTQVAVAFDLGVLLEPLT